PTLIISMRSALILLAMVVAGSATAILRQPVQEPEHKQEVQPVAKEVKHHQKPKGMYYHATKDIAPLQAGMFPSTTTFVNTGKSDVLDGMFCKICLDIVDGLENFGEETAMDYLEEATKELCDQLPFANLQKDCYDYIVGVRFFTFYLKRSKLIFRSLRI
ncbi:hypothetical protein PENTCL1PPCAC_620, partial [Pristionchus entomophagus]